MPTILPCPIQQINDFIELRFPIGHHGTCVTPPGHILHLVTQGHYHLSINKHQLHAKAGDFIIYHDLDQVDWIGNYVPVVFYSLLFKADQLPMVAYDQRVTPASQKKQHTFQQRFQHQFNHFPQAYGQQFSLCALLLEALQCLYPPCNDARSEKYNSWQELERRLRINGNFRPSLQQCCAISGTSSAGLSRLSQYLYQQSPMQRLRFVRLEQAKSLLRLSTMTISQIASYLNYPRIHEFSREFKQQCNVSPTEFRLHP